jgi:hypothetical protein
MRWLILPDIHDKLRRATQIIEREPHDRLLLMGDFFDDFRTGVTDAADTATQVKQWLNSPNTICLLGNHDMSYGWCRQNRRLLCPGYDAAKWIAINATVTTGDWQKFELHAWLDGDHAPWLVSHAGVHPVWLDGGEPCKPGSSSTGPAQTPGHVSTGANTTYFLLGRGVSRSGDQRMGGICWMDWDELVPIPGLNQLVGHTPDKSVRHKNTPTSRNICRLCAGMCGTPRQSIVAP